MQPNPIQPDPRFNGYLAMLEKQVAQYPTALDRTAVETEDGMLRELIQRLATTRIAKILEDGLTDSSLESSLHAFLSFKRVEVFLARGQAISLSAKDLDGRYRLDEPFHPGLFRVLTPGFLREGRVLVPARIIPV
jgi:hypothetical protein